jgi:hypothetical protein
MMMIMMITMMTMMTELPSHLKAGINKETEM